MKIKSRKQGESELKAQRLKESMNRLLYLFTRMANKELVN